MPKFGQAYRARLIVLQDSGALVVGGLIDSSANSAYCGNRHAWTLQVFAS